MNSYTARNALVLIAVVAVGAALYWLRGILTPLVLAIFLMFMIDGLLRAVVRYTPFIPRPAALPAAVALIVLAFLGAIWVMVDGFTGFAAELGGLRPRVDQIIADVAALAGVPVAPTADQLIDQLDPKRFLAPVAQTVQSVGADMFFVLVYLGFLIASRSGFARKARHLFGRSDDLAEARTIFDRIRDGVEGYVWVQTVTGAMIALGCWAVMAAVGLHNAAFWAFIIFLLSYIPILGGAIAGLGPPLFALAQFPTYWQAIVLVVAIQVVLFVVGNIVLPRMQAESQNVDPVVVLLSLAFWGALWGVPGAFLSTPLTVMAMAILAEFKGTRWIAVLLSQDGEPYPVRAAETARDVLPPPEGSPGKG
jgi:predicted PurR-regulated permease PerM